MRPTHEPVVGHVTSRDATPHENHAPPRWRRSPLDLESRWWKVGRRTRRDRHGDDQCHGTARYRGAGCGKVVRRRSAERGDARHACDACALRRVRARRMTGSGRLLRAIRGPRANERGGRAPHIGHGAVHGRRRRARCSHTRRGAHRTADHHTEVTNEEDEQHCSRAAEVRQHVGAI